jgi:hypothetical protein
MSDSFSDERADMAANTHLVVVTDGLYVSLSRNDMYVQVKSGSTSTAITTTSPNAVPVGLRVTFDNKNGTGTLNVNSGEIQVPAGLVYEAKVSGDGAGGQAFVVAGPEIPANTLTTGALLQSATDADKEAGRVLELQVGETEFSTRIDIDGGSGGGWYGQGRPEPIAQSNANARQGSILVYTGTKTAGQAAILYERTDFAMQDLAIQGKTTADVVAGTGTRTPRGIYISRSADSGIGTGKLEMRHVRLSGFDVAIEAGNSLAASNCDECGYYSVFSDRNGTFFRSNNAQGLSHKFYNLRASQTTTVFDYIAGGKLAVTDCLLTHECTLLQLRNDESTGFGHNASRWVFRGVDLDSGARNSYLLNCESGIDYYGDVEFHGVHLSMNGSDVWDNPGIHVGSNMTVIVNNCLNLPANFVSWNCSGNKSTIIFNNPKVYTNVSTAADIFKTSGSVGNLRCIVNYGIQYSTYTMLPVTPDSNNIYNQVLTGV